MSDFIENDEEAFLSEISYDVIIDSIERQFKNPSDWKKRDFVDLLFKRYKLIKDNTIDEDLSDIEHERDDFIITMERLFYDYLNIGLNVLEDTSDDTEIEDTIIMSFRFFINKIIKNFSNVIFNYINENKERLSEPYSKYKDVTTSAYKNDILDKDALTVLSNVGYIVNDVLQELREINDIDLFLHLCQGNKLYVELEFIKEAFNEMKLTGNFISKYIDMLDDDSIPEIKSRVRKKIIKKYNKK